MLTSFIRSMYLYCTCSLVPQICMAYAKTKKKMVGTYEKVISADKAYQYLIVANEIAFSMPKGKHTRIYTL